MRPFPLALVVSVALGLQARGSDLRTFDDAPLHAVQFVDANEGWAVGDEGVVWHSLDGGHTWERQPTGVRASLRSLHFLNPYTGWIAGREELPLGAGSVGILLFTQDGGLNWKRASTNTLPGLNRVRFLDNNKGFLVGDGCDQFPTGLFTTIDNGRTWKPVPGPRFPTWLTADFQDDKTGVIAGAWSRIATLRQGALTNVEMNTLGGRGIAGLQLTGKQAFAVGQGALVLTSDNGGDSWAPVDLHLTSSQQADWDFHGLHCLGDQVWVVGRPGSAVLHSPDHGQTWEIQRTGQPLPLNGIYFHDVNHGWAVGEFGSILSTADGGKNWRLERRGGQRAAVLFLHARSANIPLDVIALLSGQDGYLTTAIEVIAPDYTSAHPGRSTEGQHMRAAVRQAGGAAGELLWQFPVAQHLAKADATALVKNWNLLNAGRGGDTLVRQMVIALRMWRPDVVITDCPKEKGAAFPADALVAEAVEEAFTQAADATAFPEQVESLGLETWKAGKLYAQMPDRNSTLVVVDATDLSSRLQASPRNFASVAAGIVADAPVSFPPQRYYRLLAGRSKGSIDHHNLMQGTMLAPGGTARRSLNGLKELDPVLVKALEAGRNLQALAETPAGELGAPSRLLARVVPTVEGMPDDQAATTVFALANQYARLGQGSLANELFLLMVNRYPAHPLTADAFRWLIRYHSSSEVRRRQELGQFLAVSALEYRYQPGAEKTTKDPTGPGASTTVRGDNKKNGETDVLFLANHQETRQGNEKCLDLGKRLAAFCPLYATDPAIQFCLQAAHRNLGDFQVAQEWYTKFKADHAESPWRDAAAAELWLSDRTGKPPKAMMLCPKSPSPPFLDGNFDDPCWQGNKPVVLQNAVGQTAGDYPTEVRLAYDKEFLYLALRCRHPADRHIPPAKVRSKDADLSSFDHVSLLLDLDRDYSTCFRLQVDQRGCVCEDCWGDRSWNPAWFVAVHSEPTFWQIEAAIPMIELTGESVTVGRAWAGNVVRVLPGRGVQSWSLPADVEPRLEGMGLLLFTGEVSDLAAPKTIAKPGPDPADTKKSFHAN